MLLYKPFFYKVSILVFCTYSFDIVMVYLFAWLKTIRMCYVFSNVEGNKLESLMHFFDSVFGAVRCQ